MIGVPSPRVRFDDLLLSCTLSSCRCTSFDSVGLLVGHGCEVGALVPVDPGRSGSVRPGRLWCTSSLLGRGGSGLGVLVLVIYFLVGSVVKDGGEVRCQGEDRCPHSNPKPHQTI